MTLTTTIKERRRYPRMSASYEVFTTCRGKLAIDQSRDISTHGIGLLTNEQLQPGDQVDLKVIVPKATLNLEALGRVRFVSPNPNPPSPFSRLAGIEFTLGPDEAFPIAGKLGQHSRHHASHAIDIDALPLVCFRAIADFARYPEWAGTVEAMPVSERHPDGRAKKLTMIHNVFFTRLRYPLEYSFDDEHLIMRWHSVGGDVDIVGSYTFVGVGTNRTAATFTLDITINFPLAKRIANYLTGVVMRKELRGFKRFVETNAASYA